MSVKNYGKSHYLLQKPDISWINQGGVCLCNWLANKEIYGLQVSFYSWNWEHNCLNIFFKCVFHVSFHKYSTSTHGSSTFMQLFKQNFNVKFKYVSGGTLGSWSQDACFFPANRLQLNPYVHTSQYSFFWISFSAGVDIFI